MDTKKVIVTLLILTIILSVLTVAFALTGSKGTIEKRSADQATVGFEIKDINAPAIRDNSNANVGLYVSS